MQTILGVTLPRFARYGWIKLARRDGSDHGEEFWHVSRGAYLAALLSLSREWE